MPAPAPPDAIIQVGAAGDGDDVEVERKMTEPEIHACRLPFHDTEPGCEQGLIPKRGATSGCD